MNSLDISGINVILQRSQILLVLRFYLSMAGEMLQSQPWGEGFHSIQFLLEEFGSSTISQLFRKRLLSASYDNFLIIVQIQGQEEILESNKSLFIGYVYQLCRIIHWKIQPDSENVLDDTFTHNVTILYFYILSLYNDCQLSR